MGEEVNMKIDGKTYTRCDRCRKYNISLEEPTMEVTISYLMGGGKNPEGSYWLLCPECSKKFKKAMEDFINAEVKPDDLACIAYTSGTTAKSKGVMLSQRNLLTCATCCANVTPFNDSDVFLSCSSIGGKSTFGR